jgi:hypothetical protein
MVNFHDGQPTLLNNIGKYKIGQQWQWIPSLGAYVYPPPQSQNERVFLWV